MLLIWFNNRLIYSSSFSGIFEPTPSLLKYHSLWVPNWANAVGPAFGGHFVGFFVFPSCFVDLLVLRLVGFAFICFLGDATSRLASGWFTTPGWTRFSGATNRPKLWRFLWVLICAASGQDAGMSNRLLLRRVNFLVVSRLLVSLLAPFFVPRFRKHWSKKHQKVYQTFYAVAAYTKQKVWMYYSSNDRKYFASK